jgi:hypothetical protein
MPIDLTQFEGHTPGEWRAIKNRNRGFQIGGPDENGRKDYFTAVADVRVNDQTEANARLIAAAPALLCEVAELRAKVADLERTLALQQKSAELLFESQQALARRREKENRK